MADKVWRKKDGSETPLKTMTEGHIKNCMKLLEKNQKQNSKIFTYLKEELESRKPKPVAIKKKFKYIADD